MNVDHAELARSLRVPVGHCHHGNFLQTEYQLEARMVDERIEQRQLGRPRVAEEVRDAFVDKELEEGAAAGDRGHWRESRRS